MHLEDGGDAGRVDESVGDAVAGGDGEDARPQAGVQGEVGQQVAGTSMGIFELRPIEFANAYYYANVPVDRDSQREALLQAHLPRDLPARPRHDPREEILDLSCLFLIK